MRYNRFDEAYCHTVDEVIEQLMALGHAVAGVYIPEINIDGDDGDDDSFSVYAEILESDSGDVVCYIEAGSHEAIVGIISEIGIELHDGEQP